MTTRYLVVYADAGATSCFVWLSAPDPDAALSEARKRFVETTPEAAGLTLRGIYALTAGETAHRHRAHECLHVINDHWLACCQCGAAIPAARWLAADQ